MITALVVLTSLLVVTVLALVGHVAEMRKQLSRIERDVIHLRMDPPRR